MLNELFFIAITLAQGALPSQVETASPRLMAEFARLQARYESQERSVTNWRQEASRNLDLDPSVARAFAEGGDPRSVGRCVKLNNYWCIKGTGWNGMLAADEEGHAAFSSAQEGAAVAALLLRKYYLDFSRRSAQAIVTRWAPAQCGGAAAVAGAAPVLRRKGGRVHTVISGRGFRIQQARPALGPNPAAKGLAVRGIGNTLRARYLAAKGRGQRVARSKIRRSIVADAPTRTPRGFAGLGPADLTLMSKSSLSLVMIAARASPAAFAASPAVTCASDTERLRAYALKVIEGVTKSPDEDLQLFGADGAPTANLAIVMANMASVEIGPLRADPALVQTGIDSATRLANAAATANAARSPARDSSAD